MSYYLAPEDALEDPTEMRQWAQLAYEAGFRNIRSFSYDLDAAYTPEAWRGRIRASAGVAALDEDAVRNFDTDLKVILADRYPCSVLAVPHRIFAIVAETTDV